MARNNYRQRGGGDDDSRGKKNFTDIPYQDANIDLGEIPLDDIDTFIHPARDEKGVGSRMSFNVPPHVERQIQIIIRSCRFPYLRDSDFIRHAIYRHIHFCTQLRQSIPKHIIPMLDSIGEVCRDQEYNERMREAFERINQRVTHLQNSGDLQESTRLLNIVKERIDSVPPSHWQQKFKQEFEKRYQTNISSMGMAMAPVKSHEEDDEKHQ